MTRLVNVLGILLLLSGCPTDADPTDVDGDGYPLEQDCDDADPSVHPGVDERCDGIDNDCDGSIDEDPVDGTTWFIDYDADGYGSEAYTRLACEQPGGWVSSSDDCDDTEATVHPTAAEICDGLDNDCDGAVDEFASGMSTWYPDVDGDGWGVEALPVEACEAPDAHVATPGDCDDGDPAIHPDATEVCDGTDNDCDGTVDVDAEGPATWYEDADGDGFGDPLVPAEACDQPDGYVANGGDCDDSDPTVRPGFVDSCNGVDNDCDGQVDEDVKAGWILVTVDTFAGWIYEIDPSNGAMTTLSPVEQYYINSMDVLDGSLPVVHSSDGYQLMGIDICSGDVTPIGFTGVGDMGGISFREGLRLYGLDFDADQLVQLDPYTGLGTPIGDLGFNLGPDGLAYDCATDTLWGADAYTGQIFEVDTNTGAAFGFVQTAVPFTYVGLEFDHASRTLLASTGYQLYRIEPTTGATSFIGDLGGVRINDLAFHPPCP